MTEFISRKYGDEGYEIIIKTDIHEHYRATEDFARSLLDAIPAADVSPVRHGRWKYFRKQNIAVCTNCSFERDLDANFGNAVCCPNCGCRMDEGGKYA